MRSISYHIRSNGFVEFKTSRAMTKDGFKMLERLFPVMFDSRCDREYEEDLLEFNAHNV